MPSSLSLATVALSAVVSIVTGYVGALLSSGGMRRQERRVYGLALLAEVKSIHRSLLKYQARIGAYGEGVGLARLHDTRAALGFWRQDLSVYAANSGRIGLFRARTAVEIIEFYHRIRWLEARLAELDGGDRDDGPKLQDWLEAQRLAIRMTRHHGRYLSRLLRREVPPTAGEIAHAIRRLKLRRRVRVRLKSFYLRGVLEQRDHRT